MRDMSPTTGGLIMKKIIAATALGGVLLISGLGAGTAQAKPDTPSPRDSAYTQIEKAYCRVLDYEPSPRAVTSIVEQWGSAQSLGPLPDKLNAQLLHEAVTKICPEYYTLVKNTVAAH
jgi:hypothetical protein